MFCMFVCLFFDVLAFLLRNVAAVAAVAAVCAVAVVVVV